MAISKAIHGSRKAVQSKWRTDGCATDNHELRKITRQPVPTYLDIWEVGICQLANGWQKLNKKAPLEKAGVSTVGKLSIMHALEITQKWASRVIGARLLWIPKENPLSLEQQVFQDLRR